MKDIEKEKRFGFGKNWQAYLPLVDDAQIARAKESLTSFLGVSDLKGKTFLDIGSGSGLFSYAAFLLGAKEVVSFDFDEFSVAATKSLKAKAGDPANWRVEQGSALDEAYLETLGSFDIVYSWGVLHYTGAMWDAIRNTSNLVAPNGQYYIALYNNVEGRLGSKFWLAVKKKYNYGSAFTRKCIESIYTFVYFFMAPLLRFQNPFRVMHEYGKERGMDYRRDVVDWVGGYPYEYASPGELFAFMKVNSPSFVLTNLKTVGNIGNNWFVFKNQV
jgi:2-polyprenyl-6-hydroxyphenyl methylase/3-demethylubiquinone-9 3-methyltransferase